jgi:dTDP-4-amino-4,6-dideoxygalactose transaminase
MRIPPAKVYFSAEDQRAVLDLIGNCLSNGRLTMGAYGRQFEDEFARYAGTRYAVAVNSGTSAIEIPMRIFGVRNREVLVPANTFFATVLAVLHAGGRVRFVDCDPETLSLDPEDLRRKVTPSTAGVIVVHIGGLVTPKIEEIQALCREHGLFLFEDAAHAHGSAYRGRMAGTFGDAASFSFYPTKLVTCGEGGMIVTDDKRVRDEALLYRDQGKVSFTQNRHGKLGYNWRMSELHAAVGLTHFRRLEEFIAERTALAAVYDRGLRKISGLRPLAIPDGCRPNYYKYVALLDEGISRSRLKARLREEYGVGLSGEVYECPCHLQPIFAGRFRPGDLPAAEDLCARHICLPLYQGMGLDDAGYVLDSLDKVLRSECK